MFKTGLEAPLINVAQIKDAKQCIKQFGLDRYRAECHTVLELYRSTTVYIHYPGTVSGNSGVEHSLYININSYCTRIPGYSRGYRVKLKM